MTMDDIPVLVEDLDFRYPRLARVVFRSNALAATMLDQLREWHCRKAMIVVARSLAGTDAVNELSQAVQAAGLGGELFSQAMQHAPLKVAHELAARIVTGEIDALIAVGGSSISDTAKAANLLVSYGFGDQEPTMALLQDALLKGSARPLACRLISVPTTLSGGEFTSVVGISGSVTKHKAVLRHDGVCSDMIILDPALALRTPDRLWAATGMKLIDHAVERLLATNCNLLSDAQCRCGLASVLHLIEASVGGDTKAAARAALLQVLWLIQSGHGNVGTGLSHALSHQLGSICGLDHGAGSAIFLPATLRLLSRTGRIDADRVQILAKAFDIETPADPLGGVIAELEELRDRLGLPCTLEEAGVVSFDVDLAVRAVLADPTIRSSPGQPFAPGEITALLESGRSDAAVE